jgi:hypothetical protein
MCITRQLGHKFKLTVDDFFDPFSQKPLYVERVVECRYVSSATKNFGVSQAEELRRQMILQIGISNLVISLSLG